MKNINRYTILKDIGLIIQFHQNVITFEGIKRLMTNIIADKDFNPEYRFLIEISRAKLNMTEDELFDYGDWMVENLQLKGSKRLAFLTVDPDQVVQATIFTIHMRFSFFHHKIFSTLDSAIKWLYVDYNKLDIVKAEIEKLIEK